MLATICNVSSLPPLSFPNSYFSLLFSGNIFTQQPSYYNDLDETMPTILQVSALSPAQIPSQLGGVPGLSWKSLGEMLPPYLSPAPSPASPCVCPSAHPLKFAFFPA